VLLKFHSAKQTRNGIEGYGKDPDDENCYFDIWVDANHIGIVDRKYRGCHQFDVTCIRLQVQHSGNLFLCPEKHPLESMEELVKLINQAKKK